MKLSHGVIIGWSLFIAGVIGFKSLDYSRKDKVTIDTVFYSPKKNILTIVGQAYDKEGIKKMRWYIDDDIIPISQVYKDGKPIAFEEGEEIFEPKNYSYTNSFPYNLETHLKDKFKEKNVTLKVVLEDLEGNIMEDNLNLFVYQN